MIICKIFNVKLIYNINNMELIQDYKKNKYKLKLSKSLKEAKYINTIKYYNHLKYHITNGGYNEKKFNFHDCNEKIKLIKIENIKSLNILYTTIIKNYLNIICSDANECIGFGLEINKIRTYFDNFTNFSYVTEYNKINNSDNGYLHLITYEKNNYSINAILKSSNSKSADNLYYEYMVGKFLNTCSIYFPCFIETYNLYEYKDDDSKNIIDSDSHVPNKLENNLSLIKDVSICKIHDSCNKSALMAVLIQSIKDPYDIEEYIKKINDEQDIKKINHLMDDLTLILFQVYLPLHFLSKMFTHYDLHSHNVLLYEPVKDKVIKFIYHINPQETISFYSPYIVKIIDYGRSYYYNTDTDNTSKIIDKIEKDISCKKDLKNSGYLYITNKKNYDICRDLILLYYIYCDIKNKNDSSLYKIFESKLHEKNKYLLLNKIIPGKINNVNDAFKELKEIIVSDIMKKNNDFYGNKNENIIGELNIYCDKSKEIEFKKY